ncbi:MAG: ABC transporter ATP-binding protein [Angustibacter sp.]
MSTDAQGAVVVQNLICAYRGRRVVDGVHLRADFGQVTAVLGPNGAGKTTVVECCEGLRRPDSGLIRVLGRDPAGADAGHRAQVGVMVQDGGLPNGVRALRLLRHIARLYANPRPVDELADLLNLHPIADTPVRRLSGGQRQRLALACALVGRPRVVFLDEPSSGLDPHSRRAVWDLIGQLRDEGRAVIVTTHLMDEAERLADRVVVLDRGRVVADGTPWHLTGAGQRNLEDVFLDLTGRTG